MKHKNMAAIDRARPDGLYGPDIGVVGVIPPRHWATAAAVLALGHGVGLVSCKQDSGHYWVAFCASRQFGALAQIDLDLLSLANDIEMLIASECEAYDEAIRQEIERVAEEPNK